MWGIRYVSLIAKELQFVNVFRRENWLSLKSSSNFYSGNIPFESRTEHQLLGAEIFVVFLSCVRKEPWQYLNLDYNRSITFFRIYHSIIIFLIL
jgi:hypothetical protein